MYSFHGNVSYYFQMQYWTSRDFVLPAVSRCIDLNTPKQILEVGCAEAGVLKAFIENGHKAFGIDLALNRLELAREFQKDAIEKGQLEIAPFNIYDDTLDLIFHKRFDVIVLKDVIEHVPDQFKFIQRLTHFLNSEGVIFFAFPPWFMPFGGHQQMCRSGILKRIPWIHLLPSNLYKKLLHGFGEPEPVITELLEIKETGISIEKFEEIANQLFLQIIYRKLYLTNPIYKFKFKLPVLGVPLGFRSIPFLRNFYSTCAYYILR